MADEQQTEWQDAILNSSNACSHKMQLSLNIPPQS